LNEQVQVKHIPAPSAWVTLTKRVQYDRPFRMV
jgi:hypothetical protein